jgi:hypothetical protein
MPVLVQKMRVCSRHCRVPPQPFSLVTRVPEQARYQGSLTPRRSAREKLVAAGNRRLSWRKFAAVTGACGAGALLVRKQLKPRPVTAEQQRRRRSSPDQRAGRRFVEAEVGLEREQVAGYRPRGLLQDRRAVAVLAEHTELVRGHDRRAIRGSDRAKTRVLSSSAQPALCGVPDHAKSNAGKLDATPQCTACVTT